MNELTQDRARIEDQATADAAAGGETRTLTVLRPELQGCCGLSQNISTEEKQWSLWGGAALVAAGLARGKLQGMVLAGLGAGLIYRGSTGHCHMYEALGVDTSETGPHRKVVAE